MSYVTTGGGEVGKGSTRVESQLNWLDKVVSMEKMSLQNQKDYLNSLLRNEQVTAEESYNIRYKLLQLEEKITDEEKRNLQERSNNYLALIDRKKELDQISLKSEIASYEYGLNNFKLTADQKHSYEVRLYNARKKLREQEEKEEKERTA